MPVIASRSFTSGTQQYLSMSAADYVRSMNVGSSWMRLRIGMLCSLGTVNENAWPIRGCTLSLGVCSGPASTISVQAPRHCIGYGWPTYPAAADSQQSVAYNAGSGGNSYFSSSAFIFIKYENGTATTQSTGSVAVNIPTNTTLGGASARRGMLILDINKSAAVTGNMTQGVSATAAAHMGLDMTSADLYSALEWYASAPTVQGTALNTLALGNSHTFNEITNGSLDTVFVFWGHYTVPFQLYELAVYRVG